ncbi:opioid growth factor receptor-like protein 1 isoform X2 [Ruditapes philippinarum]|uniref:opioid growth factor receptor-like protein 1 isoform X2 n=1 Tax=Ruditapes philippinarum TaxID=129788 RepID=UPI00295BB3FE|nr:opioid growth factor receptor-like protein 1 isoform X2 [Ruditapes philippinarum]
MLEDIGGFGVTVNEGLEYKPAEYKSVVKKTIEQKSLTIEQDQAECDEKSDDYKELEALKQNTEQTLQEVEKVINRPEPEEMIDKIDSLNKELESKKSEEIRLKKESAKTIENLQNKVKSLEKEKKVTVIENKVQQYKNENESLKEYTSLHEETCDDHPFQQKIDTIADDVANERGGDVSHQSQTKVHKNKKDDETLEENTSMHEESDELQFQRKIDTMTDEIANEKDGNILHQSQTSSKYVEDDIQQYINGYPDQEDDPMRNENYNFFMDEIPSRPNGDCIDTIHNEWWGDYKRLEENKKYMQWLFPVRAKSCNREAQELFPHEIQKICNCKEAKDRLLLSYKLMLDFYGIKLENKKDGTVVRSDNWEERFENLNRSKHNHNRITRILKSLGELGFEHLKKNFIKFILVEILERKTLANLQESCCNYWIAILKDPSERAEMEVFYQQLTTNQSNSLT